MDLHLQGTRALVVAASSGLGLACAEALAGEQAMVVISARDGRRLEQAMGHSGAVGFVPCDLNEKDDINRLVGAAVDMMGGLDALVVNCGPPPVGVFADASDEHWERGFAGVTMSAVRLIRTALPHLTASGRGRIVALTGYGFREPQSGLVVSEAHRSAVALLVKVIANDYGAAGLTANNIAPGPILTDRLTEIHRANAERSGMTEHDYRVKAADEIPLNRFGEPTEVGALCAYLCSAQAGYITGQTIVIDGGYNRSV